MTGLNNLAIALILISLPSASRAEKPEVSENFAATIRFACAAWKELPCEAIFYREGREFHPIQFYPGKCSELYSLTDVDSLELHTRKENAKGELIYELVGLAPLIKDTDQMLFLVEEADAPDSLSLKLRGLDDSWEAFRVNALRFVNSTSDPLEVVIGEKTAQLPSGLTIILELKVRQNGGLVSFYLKDRAGITIYENRLFLQTNARQTVVIYPPQKEGKRIKLKFLSQKLPAKTSNFLKNPSNPHAVHSEPHTVELPL